jgi:hypothetical protein
MCVLCDGGTVEDLFRETRSGIETDGFTMVAVGDGNRGWAYTIGLLATFGHPELVVTGGSGDFDIIENIISHVVHDIRGGGAFDENSPDVMYHGVPFRFGSVHRTQWVHGRFAMWERYYEWLGDAPLIRNAVQVLWANEDDVFPPDPDFCDVHRDCQPLLSVPVGHDVSEVARRQRRPKKRRR